MGSLKLAGLAQANLAHDFSGRVQENPDCGLLLTVNHKIAGFLEAKKA